MIRDKYMVYVGGRGAFGAFVFITDRGWDWIDWGYDVDRIR